MKKAPVNIENYSNNKLIEEMTKRIKEKIEIIDKNIEYYEKDNWSNFKKNRERKRKPKLSKMIMELRNLEASLSLMKKYDIPKDLKNNFLRLKDVLPQEDFKYFKEVIDNEIIKYNKKIKTASAIEKSDSRYDNVNKALKNTIKAVKSDNIYKFQIHINHDHFYFEQIFEEIDRRIEEFYSYSGIGVISATSISKEKTLEDFNLSKSLSRVDKILNGGNDFPSFMNNPDKKVSNIINDFKKIKEAFLTREKLIYTKSIMTELLKNFALEKCDFSDTKEVLNYMIKKYEKQIEKISKYLNKYDLSHLDNLYAKEEAQNEHDIRLAEYKAYAYQLERAKAAEDMEKVKEIEESMQRIATYGNLLDSEKMVSAANAEVEYIEDSNVKESEKKTRDKMQKNPDSILIAKDYVRYLGGLKDKKDKISFAEFGKQRYNAIVNEIMLPEELRNEIKRKSK